MRNLQPDQFDPSQVGPAEARRMSPGYSHYLTEMSEENRRNTPQLFSTRGNAFKVEPHQQFRHEFAADDRTWWHGRYGEQLPRTGGQRNAGIHVGTFGSADARRRALGTSRKVISKESESGDVELQPWRSFPVRLRGATDTTPSEPSYDEGNRWMPRPGINYYTNMVEDSGSISALAPSRQFLQTHSQAIKEAKAAGKPVHPLIEWESKQLGRRDYDPGQEDPQAGAHRGWLESWKAQNDSPQLFNTAPYNESRHDRVARRRTTAIDAGIKDYAGYAVR